MCVKFTPRDERIYSSKMNNMFYIAYNLEYTNYFVKGNITWAIINFICILWFYRLLALTIVVLDVRSMRFHIIKTFRGAG